MKVFLVDDNPGALKMLGFALDKAGYETSIASGGIEALQKIPAERPDIVILDVMMPDLDGIEATRHLRADPRTAHIPIILLTAKDQIQDKLAGFESGADDYVVKPVLPSELIARVNALLRRSQLQAQPASPAARVIGFLGAKGGVGTTSLAVNVAVALAQAGKDVILADLHPWAGSAGLQMGLPRRAGRIPLVDQAPSEITSHMLDGAIERHKSGVRILTMHAGDADVGRELAPEAVTAVLDQLETMGQVVIVDMGNGLTATALESLKHCHLTVLALEADSIAISLAGRAIQRMEAMGLAGSRLELVVVNRSRSASTYTRTELEELLGSELLAVFTPAPEIFFRATREASPVLVSQPDTGAAVQLRELSEHLI